MFIGLLLVMLIPAGQGARADQIGPAPAPTERRSLAPTPDDGEIAYVTARVLEQGHYRQHPFDDAYSEKFLQMYLQALDPQRLYFTQADLAEFALYRDRLDNLTLGRRLAADTKPAYRIFNRFLERLDQRVAYVQELLQQEQFTFATDESIVANRKEEPYPVDLAEARHLWRQRLRSEYLQEVIAKYAERQKAARDARKKGTAAGQSTTQTNAVPAPPADASPEADAAAIVEKLNKRYTRNQHIYHELDQQDVLEFYLTSLADRKSVV